MKREVLPHHDAKYEVLRTTEWCLIEEAFKSCCKFEPNARSSATQVLCLLESESGLGRVGNEQQTSPCQGI